jgi:hypothetical protein
VLDKIDRFRLPLKFDVQHMQDDLRQLTSTAWIDHFVQQNYQGHWSVIPLRGPASATHPILSIYADPMCQEFADTPLLKDLQYFPKILASIHCPLQSVRLMKLSPGSQIKEHRDLDLDLDSGSARLHIPIQTNEGVDFRLNGVTVPLQEGECWYLRLSDPHSVTNRGQSDRIHLVIDVGVTPWLLEHLTSAFVGRARLSSKNYV